MLGMFGSLESLLLDRRELLRGLVRAVALLLSVAARALFVAILGDLRLGMVLGLLDGACRGVLLVDQLLMLGLGSLFGLGLRDFDLLLLLLELLDPLVGLSVVLLLGLLLDGLLVLVALVRLLGDLLEVLGVRVVVSLDRLLCRLGRVIGSITLVATAAFELLLDVLNDGVVVAGEGLGIDAMQVVMGDLILELGLDLGADTLDDLARGDLLALFVSATVISRRRAGVVGGAGAIISGV